MQYQNYSLYSTKASCLSSKHLQSTLSWFDITIFGRTNFGSIAQSLVLFTCNFRSTILFLVLLLPILVLQYYLWNYLQPILVLQYFLWYCLHSILVQQCYLWYCLHPIFALQYYLWYCLHLMLALQYCVWYFLHSILVLQYNLW